MLQLVKCLAEGTAEKTEDHGQPLDKNAVEKVLATLAQQCEEYDTSALETIGKNSALFSNDFLSTELLLLEKAMENYDFETAQAVIDQMLDWIATEKI